MTHVATTSFPIDAAWNTVSGVAAILRLSSAKPTALEATTLSRVTAANAIAGARMTGDARRASTSPGVTASPLSSVASGGAMDAAAPVGPVPLAWSLRSGRHAVATEAAIAAAAIAVITLGAVLGAVLGATVRT